MSLPYDFLVTKSPSLLFTPGQSLLPYFHPELGFDLGVWNFQKIRLPDLEYNGLYSMLDAD